jgi:hypothetical protein
VNRSNAIRGAAMLAVLAFISDPRDSALAQGVSNGVVCKEAKAPAAFQIVKSKDSKDAGNDGIKPLGFVNLGEAAPVIHGIDISSYQDEADFTSVKTCGGEFVYVRLTAGVYKDNELKYRTHWANVRAAGLVPGPYHNLSVLPREVANISALKTALQGPAIDAAIEQARAAGQIQATNFIERLDEVSGLDPQTEGATRPMRLPIALDLSTSPVAGSAPDVKERFGALYRAAICGFVEGIKTSKKYSGERMVLFVSPTVFSEYGLRKADCDNRYRSIDGDIFAKTLPRDAQEALCGQAGEGAGSRFGRCVIEQYTSFGGFAVFQPGAPLDLDRFLGPRSAFDSFLLKE